MSCVSCSNDNGPCGKKNKELRSLRNQIVTLHNTTKDYDKKVGYKEILSNINEVSKNIDSCPEKILLSSLRDYIENERIERNK